MRNLFLSLMVSMILIPTVVSAWHWQKVEARYNSAVTTTPVQLNGSTTACHGFAIWEDTKTMELDVYLGNTYTANVFYTKVLVGEVLEINYYDGDLITSGIYCSTTDTAKVNYISRIKRGY
ncbi:MAG: hypothetical protein GY797_33450 [Deltaproteobacteria bacterium]|nr:hypothetical protein [Deltaproteobacteria bacterium]